MMSVIKKLGSVGFTVMISVALILLLIIATSMEAVHGTPFAQKAFYQTRWFDMVVALLWINIFCSTVLRFPFKQGQIGFLITHSGILLLLTGALMTRMYGIEGEMTIFEGETRNAIKQSGYALSATFPNQEEVLSDLRQGNIKVALTRERLNAAAPFCPLEPKKAVGDREHPEQMVDVNIVNIIEKASERRQVIIGDAQAPVNHAIEVRVHSQQLAQDTAVWLVEHDTQDHGADTAMAGPIKLMMRPDVRPAPAQQPILHIVDQAGKEILAINVSDTGLAKSIRLGKTGLTIKDLEYYPYATVSANKLINFPEGKRLNPAVVFNLVDAKKVSVRQVKFAFFPEFESMHPQVSKTAARVQIKFEAGKPQAVEEPFDGLQVSFVYDQGNSWKYRTKFQDKFLAEGNVVAGACVPAGWSDAEFCVRQTMSRAQISYDIAPSENGQGGVLAAAVTVPAASPADVFWVFEGRRTPVRLAQGEIKLSLVPETRAMPFALTLKQFRKVDYPGTQDAASYESDVVLVDTVRKVSLERTVVMNHPLEYDGYKIFQSSYFNDPEAGKASVFTVSKNPGIPWIYIGSILACLGAIFQFYGPEQKKVA